MSWQTGGAPALEVTDSNPAATAVGDSASAGSASVAARADHTHAREAFAAPGSSMSHGGSNAAGSAATICKGDHVHSLPASGGAPSDVIGYFQNACPSGWSEYTAARGRYVVGTPSGGTAEGTSGTALSNSENRPVGQHVHTAGADNNTGSNCMNYWKWDDSNQGNKSTVNSGNVAGTNAPYIQLITCKKD